MFYHYSCGFPQILVYTSAMKASLKERDLTLVWKNSSLDVSSTVEK